MRQFNGRSQKGITDTAPLNLTPEEEATGNPVSKAAVPLTICTDQSGSHPACASPTRAGIRVPVCEPHRFKDSSDRLGDIRRNSTRNSFVGFAGCGSIFRTRFQSRKRGDMACVRGPLGACVATCHNVGSREGPLLVFETVPLCHCRTTLKSFDWTSKQLG
jgi:hypothetical protein